MRLIYECQLLDAYIKVLVFCQRPNWELQARYSNLKEVF